MNLGSIITALEAADPEQPVPHGFTNPHSYRGDYMDLAFEPAADTTVGAMLTAARSALGATFQGWKGGDFLMDADTWCWLSPQGDASCETLSPETLAWMLRPAAATVPASAPADRSALSARLWAVAEHNIVAEWICCEPINPEHDLCVQGDATRRMVRALLVDDPDAYRPAPLLDAVLADAASGPGGAAGETQQDDAPYPPSVEWRTQTQRRGDHWITWHGVQYELAEARSDFADTVERDGRRHAWRLIRETTTYAVEAEQPAAVSQHGKDETR